MKRVEIAEHALKHGICEEDIRHAWTNYLRKQYRGAPNEGEIVAIGYTRDGILIQIVATDTKTGVLIYHAMSPPTKKVMQELGLERKRNGHAKLKRS